MDKNDAAARSASKPAKKQTQSLIQEAEKLAEDLSKQKDGEALETQLYKFLAAMRKVEMQAKKKPVSTATEATTDTNRDEFIRDQLPLLKYKFAYAASRKQALKSVYKAIKDLMEGELGQDFAGFERLLDFVEAVIAYHKYHAKNKEEAKDREDESHRKEPT